MVRTILLKRLESLVKKKMYSYKLNIKHDVCVDQIFIKESHTF